MTDATYLLKGCDQLKASSSVHRATHSLIPKLHGYMGMRLVLHTAEGTV